MSTETDDIFFTDLPASSATETPVSEPERLVGYVGALPASLRQTLLDAFADAQLELRDEISAETRFALLPATAERPFHWPNNHQGGPALYFQPSEESPAASADLTINFLESASGAAIAQRIRQTVAGFEQLRRLQQQVTDSTHVAMHAMSLNAELGRILEFVEKSYECADEAALAQAALQCLNSMQMDSVIQFDASGRHYSNGGTATDAERHLLTDSRSKGRIVDHGAISLFHYPRVSALIRNMPLTDLQRYGVLKDHLCLLFNGLEARATALHTEQLANTRAHRSLMTAKVIHGILADMDEYKRAFTQRSSEILENLLLDLRTALAELALNEAEEDKLQTLVETANNAFAELFAESEQRDRVFNEILGKLTVLLQAE
ncbi:MAG TPA: hypothetical protein VFV64_09630 [Permianibacter sp.]|nr:hypothetical protein [Permianibacter sp.]